MTKTTTNLLELSVSLPRFDLNTPEIVVQMWVVTGTQTQSVNVRFEVFTAVTINIAVWNDTV
jgi:hypothetical protein